LSTVGVVAVKVGQKALERFEEALQVRVLPFTYAWSGSDSVNR
jgi:hypothetical protein